MRKKFNICNKKEGFRAKTLLVFHITEINLYTSLRFVHWILSQGHTQEIVTKTGS